jgi:hypothetical protein
MVSFITLLTIVGIISLGTIGAVTAVMNIPNAEAKSCNQFDFGFDCVEGSIFSQGAIGSDGQCHHHR